jgi:MFS family permease
MRSSSLVLRSALIAALGGLLFGFDTAVISGTVDALKEVFFLDDWMLGFTVASALIGTILGAATAQIPSNKWGRKPTLIVMAVFFLVSAIGCAFAWDWTSFFVFRFLGGIAIGAASVVSPLYTAEISPAKQRGLLVALTQFNIVFGILLAFFSNYIIALLNLGETDWRWMFGVAAIPSAAFLVFLFAVPESPRWLVSRKKLDDAKKVLTLLGSNAEETENEIRSINEAIETESINGKERFFTYRLRFPIMLAICMAAFNQLSGINAVLYYAPKVFAIAGASKSLAMFLPVIIGLTNLVFTMAALPLIDKVGRRTLMFAGSIGYITSLLVVAGTFIVYAPEFNLSISNAALSEATAKLETAENALNNAAADEKSFRENDVEKAKNDLTAAESNLEKATAVMKQKHGAGEIDTQKIIPMSGILFVLGGLMLFIASHAFGQGACIWVFIGEIFPNKVRAQGQALGSFVHWILAAVVSLLFPPLLVLLGPANIFLLFAFFMVMQLLWVIGFMPETKQIPLEEMQKKLGIA